MARGLDEGADPANATTRDASPLEPSDTLRGQAIGPYRLLQKVGEGGMGEVWLAEQEKPVRRRVALKVIKRGMDTKEVIARFASERQALALMDHPAIAKVFDAGSTPRGRPYFAMEYVQGEPITTYCDRQRLDMAQRLALFQVACAGVQHAHQKGIIHRDLKPSNVLVKVEDGKAVPKIIDFGVAKATAQRLTEHSVFTELGVLIGTPEYMSPEQAEMTAVDVDTRTDVYALGVLIYELLTGALPFESEELRKAGYDEIRRKIREDDPPKPSARLSTLSGEKSTKVAQRRHTDSGNLRREVQGDLDWITMKAMEKDRTRRYGSPNELAADIGRHLRYEPVEAGPPSATYRAKKFVRRNRVGVTFASVLLILLIGFAVTITVQAGRLAVQRDRANEEAVRANREAETANRVSEFMTRLFEIPVPGQVRCNSITAREILDRGEEQIERGLEDEPLIKAKLLNTMGRTYHRLGMGSQAVELLDKALELGERHLESDDPRLATMLFDLGAVHNALADSAQAQELGERSLAIRRRVLPPEHPDLAWTLTFLGWIAHYTGRPEEAEDYARESAAIWDSHREVDDWRDGMNLTLLMLQAISQGRSHEAIEMADEVMVLYDRIEAAGGYWDPQGNPLTGVAFVYMRSGEFERSVKIYQRMVKIQAKLYGTDSAEVGTVLWQFSIAYKDAGQYQKARELCEQAVAILEKDLDSLVLGMALNSLATTLELLGETDAALQIMIRALAQREKTLGLDNPRLAFDHSYLSLNYLLSGDQKRGRFHYRRVLEVWNSPSSPKSLASLDRAHRLARLVLEAGEQEDAARLYAIAIAEWGFSSPRHPGYATVLEEYAALLWELGRDAEAAEQEAKAVEIRKDNSKEIIPSD